MKNTINYIFTIKTQKIKSKLGKRKRTDKGSNDENNVESQTGTGGDEESGDGWDGNDDCADGDGKKQLDGYD